MTYKPMTSDRLDEILKELLANSSLDYETTQEVVIAAKELMREKIELLQIVEQNHRLLRSRLSDILNTNA